MSDNQPKFQRKRRVTPEKKATYAAMLLIHANQCDAYRATFPNAAKTMSEAGLRARACELAKDETVVAKKNDIQLKGAENVADMDYFIALLLTKYKKYAEVDTDEVVRKVLETGTLAGVDTNNSTIKSVHFRVDKGVRTIASMSLHSPKEALDSIRETVRVHLEERARKAMLEDNEVVVAERVVVDDKLALNKKKDDNAFEAAT